MKTYRQPSITEPKINKCENKQNYRSENSHQFSQQRQFKSYFFHEYVCAMIVQTLVLFSILSHPSTTYNLTPHTSVASYLQQTYTIMIQQNEKTIPKHSKWLNVSYANINALFHWRFSYIIVVNSKIRYVSIQFPFWFIMKYCTLYILSDLNFRWVFIII